MFKCAECKEKTENILVDEPSKPPLEFCSWECLMKYAVKKYTREQPTRMSS